MVSLSLNSFSQCPLVSLQVDATTSSIPELERQIERLSKVLWASGNGNVGWTHTVQMLLMVVAFLLCTECIDHCHLELSFYLSPSTAYPASALLSQKAAAFIPDAPGSLLGSGPL